MNLRSECEHATPENTTERHATRQEGTPTDTTCAAPRRATHRSIRVGWITAMLALIVLPAGNARALEPEVGPRLGALGCGTELTPSEFDRYRAEIFDAGSSLPPGVEPGSRTYHLPVTYHVIRRSDGSGGIPESRIGGAQSHANFAFRELGFVFCRPVATRFIDDTAWYTRLDTSEMDDVVARSFVPGTINVYIAPNPTQAGAALCGAAPLASWADDWVLMRDSCFGTVSNPSTFPHELGHFFNLLHTHDGGDECVDGSNCDWSGDLICDTPPDPRLGGHNINPGCEYVGTEVPPCGGDFYDPDPSNYMSYAPARCRSLFTPGQNERMLSALLTYLPELVYDGCPDIRLDAPHTLERLTVSQDGDPSNGESWSAALSGDGRFAVVATFATNVAMDEKDVYSDLVVLDRRTGQRRIASEDSAGRSLEGDAYSPALTPSGRHVAFVTTADADPGDTNGLPDIYLKDLRSGTLEWISRAHDGSSADEGCFWPSISDDGRRIVYGSRASNLVPGDGNADADVFLYDRARRSVRRVSVAVDGGDPLAWSSSPRISGNGSAVVFDSAAENLVPEDSNGRWDVFLADLTTGAIECVSLNVDGDHSTGHSFDADVSANGRFVSFTSSAVDLVPDGPMSGVYVRDRSEGTTEIVSVKATGQPGDRPSDRARITRNGRFVTFRSWAVLDAVDPGGRAQAYIHDRRDGGTRLVSRGFLQQAANNEVFAAEPADDGSTVLFVSPASNLTEADTDGLSDVYAWTNFERRDVFDGPPPVRVPLPTGGEVGSMDR